jgi:signal recognition particle subunit SRP54
MIHPFAERPFDFDEFRRTIHQMRKAQRFNARLGTLPMLGKLIKQHRPWLPESQEKRVLGIIDAMTPEERRRPYLIDIPRRRHRVARGAGVEPVEVLRAVECYDAMAGIVRHFARMGFLDRMRLLLGRASS